MPVPSCQLPDAISLKSKLNVIQIMSFNTKKFRELLAENREWPMLYYFKFIVYNNQQKLDQVKELFADPSTITYKTSKDIKFISLSCKQFMPDPESIIAIYEKASKVDGLIAL